MSKETPSRDDGVRDGMRRAAGRVLREEGGLTRFVRDHRLTSTLVFFGILSAISVTVSFFLRFVLLEDVLATSLNNWHLWWLAMLVVTVPVRLLFFWAAGIHHPPWRFASST